MILSLLGLAILLIGPLLIGASAYFPSLAAVGGGWIGGVVVVAIVDNLLSRRVSRVVARRVVSDRLSLGTENRIEIHLHSRSRLSLTLLVKDDPPWQFNTPVRQQRLRLAPFDARRISYVTIPQARGDYQFGDLHLRGRSRLGLSWWQRRIPAEEQVKVYPDLLQIRRYDLLARSDRLLQVGFRRLRHLGEGTEFESLREYVPDDDFTDIDWKATARRNKPITRQYEIERSQNVILMVDAGRMMCAELNGMSKLDYAINAALMLAYVAVQKDDAVGLVVFADEIQSFVPPRKGSAQVGRLLEQLYAVQPTMQEPDYAAAFSLLANRARKRALIVVFTDLIDPQASRQLLAHTAALYPHHLPLVVTLRDPRLHGLAGQIPQQESDAYQRAVAADLLTHRQEALSALRQRGASIIDALPERLTVSAVNRYLALKARGRL